jgi:hypothetical protein
LRARGLRPPAPRYWAAACGARYGLLYGLLGWKKLLAGFSLTYPGPGLPDFLVTWYQKRKNVPNEHKVYQMVIKYLKSPENIPNGHKMYEHFPILGLPKFTQIGILGLKTNHLATLPRAKFYVRLLNLQLQRRRCSTIKCFYKKVKDFFSKYTRLLVAL